MEFFIESLDRSDDGRQIIWAAEIRATTINGNTSMQHTNRDKILLNLHKITILRPCSIISICVTYTENKFCMVDI